MKYNIVMKDSIKEKQLDLYINIGNTNITFAYTETNKIEDLQTITHKKENLIKKSNFEKEINSIIDSFKFKIKKVFMCSVSNETFKEFEKILKTRKISIIKINFENQSSIDLSQLHNPYELGADILAQTSYVTHFFQEAIVVSLGTATSIYYVKKNLFGGCIILPGIYESVKSIVNSTDIKSINLESYPKSVLGSNTNEAISIGIINSIKVVVDNIQKTLKTKCPIIYTGGNSHYFKQSKWWHIKNLEILGLFVFSQKF